MSDIRQLIQLPILTHGTRTPQTQPLSINRTYYSNFSHMFL